jgi:hypothetical protein
MLRRSTGVLVNFDPIYVIVECHMTRAREQVGILDVHKCDNGLIRVQVAILQGDAK